MTNHELTQREKQILKLIAQGFTNKKISIHLSIAESTVENHIHNIYSKLHISSRSQATAFAFQTRLMIAENNENEK